MLLGHLRSALVSSQIPYTPRVASADLRQPELDFPMVGLIADLPWIYGDPCLPLVAELGGAGSRARKT